MQHVILEWILGWKGSYEGIGGMILENLKKLSILNVIKLITHLSKLC